jgi:phage gp46-like protein
VTDFEYNVAVDPDTQSLETDESLRTRVLLSLLTWARADPDDPVPDNGELKGWWGDSYPDVAGRKYGSKLWIVQPMPASQETLQLARKYAEEALQWMVEDGIADSVTVDELEIQERPGGAMVLAGRIGIQRPGDVALAFVELWDVTLQG